ncbi:plasmid replication protein, CyRepA1 family [Tumidithrix elongata RA019]|uniref:Plasmid replication protein, CyRepA1 family n=1 Tax=Tumidithrix elongata BACA0141 TaxID=2716417 RepID=A0AAW9Q8U8_9CYAN|nr:plasmid replication protein, CyRepA1 family [Tumidithrix elongata RA019]
MLNNLWQSASAGMPTHAIGDRMVDAAMPHPVSTPEIYRQQVYREWVEGSAISPELFYANVTIAASEAIEHGGDVSRPLHDALNWKVDRWRDPRYSGAIIHTLDPIAGIRQVFQVKLEKPIYDAKRDRFRKYENPSGRGQVGGFASVDLLTWQKIGDRYGILLPSDLSDRQWYDREFWNWVIEFGLPIFITEGMKKACALLSQGHVAIALSGITMGRQNIEGKTQLQAYLDIFATPKRDIYLCFDAETKPKTIFDVYLAQSKTGKLFEDKGCQVRVLQLPLLPNTDKTGVDDLIVTLGGSALLQCIDAALSLSAYRWQFNYKAQLQTEPAISFSSPSLLQAVGTLPSSGIIAISSAKGTEKTKLLARETANDTKLVALTHLRSLRKNLAHRLNLQVLNDLDRAKGFGFLGNTDRIALCVHSLLAINPRDYIGCTLAIDEAAQVFRTLLTSKLCNKNGMRGALLARLEELMRVAGRIVIADADLSDFELNYTQKLRGDNGQPYLILNHYKAESYAVAIVDSPTDDCAIAMLMEDLRVGEKVMICCDSKDKADAIAKMVRDLGLDLRVMLVTSDGEQADADTEEDGLFVAEINQRVTAYDLLIVSPSMSTGVSIETPHFSKVYGFFSGVLGDGDIAQMLIRYRPNVPRVLWCKKSGNQFSQVSRGESASMVREALHTSHDAEISCIRHSLASDLIPFVHDGYRFDRNPHIDLFCQYTAQQNQAMRSLRANLIARLQYEGCKLEIVTPEVSIHEAKELMKASKQAIAAEHAHKLCQVAILKGSELKRLRDKENPTREERLILEASTIAEELVADKLTTELVDFWHRGRVLHPLRELEATLNPELAVSTDTRQIAKQASFRGFGTAWDIPKLELRRQIRERSGFVALLNRLIEGETITLFDLQQEFEPFLGKYGRKLADAGLPAYLQKSVSYTFGRWLELLGVKFHTIRDRSTNLETHFQIDRVYWEILIEILARRAEQRVAFLSGVSSGRSQLLLDPKVVSEREVVKEVEGDRNLLPLFIDPPVAIEEKSLLPEIGAIVQVKVSEGGRMIWRQARYLGQAAIAGLGQIYRVMVGDLPLNVFSPDCLREMTT